MPIETGTVAVPAQIAVAKGAWPTRLPDQIRAVAEVLALQSTPAGIDAIASNFSARGRWRERLPTILETLEALGRARQVQPGSWVGSGFE